MYLYLCAAVVRRLWSVNNLVAAVSVELYHILAGNTLQLACVAATVDMYLA